MTKNSGSFVRKDRQPTKYKRCSACNKDQVEEKHFYASKNPFDNGRVSVCKSCLKANIDYDDLSTVKAVLLQINKPFLHSLWMTSVEEAKTKNNINPDVLGVYMKSVFLNYGDMTWKDSDSNMSDSNPIPNLSESRSSGSRKEGFILTDEIIDKWGEGYSDEEYRAFEKKWSKLIDNYGEKTSLHIEGLKTYIRFRVKEEMATASGQVKDAKDWAALAKDAATAAKINVSQLSKSDISGGVDLLPQLFEAVESEVGIIPVLPHLKEQPYDDADIIIWCVVNYLRRLEDKPRIAYGDIWNFYDEMLIEHFKQKGFSDELIAKEKAKRNNVFRDLGEVYREPIYEEGEN